MTEWNDEDHDLLDDLIQRLEDAWRTAGAVDLAQFVPAADHPIRQRALVALIQVDQELRWRHGQRKTVEEYLAEWPELREKPACIQELQEAQRLLEADTRTTPPAAPAETQDFALPNQPRANSDSLSALPPSSRNTRPPAGRRSDLPLLRQRLQLGRRRALNPLLSLRERGRG
jgi:hypothetical protein